METFKIAWMSITENGHFIGVEIDVEGFFDTVALKVREDIFNSYSKGEDIELPERIARKVKEEA